MVRVEPADNGLRGQFDDAPHVVVQRADQPVALQPLAQDWFADEPLRFPHFVTLCWVEHLGPCAQRRLAEAMDSDPSDLVPIITALEAAALLTRTTDPDDRRRNLLDVTGEGRAWLRTRQDRAREYDAVLCASLPDGGAVLRDQLAVLLSLRVR